MIYLDCAATSLQKPDTVGEAMLQGLQCGNAGRGAHEASLSAGRIVYETREKIAKLFGVGDPMRVCMMFNTTDALNAAICGLIRAGDHVVTTAQEHNSVLRPLYRAQAEGAELTIVPAQKDGKISEDAVLAAIRPDTRAVVCAHASNVTGNSLNIAKIGHYCKKNGALLIVDAAQSAGTLPINMQKMEISVLCMPGHKGLFAPQGTGVLCVSEDTAIEPFRVGGSGIHSFSKTHPAEFPTILEAGTLNTSGIAGLSAGLDYIQQIGIQTIHAHEMQLANAFYQEVSQMPNITVYGDWTQKDRAAIVTLNMKGKTASQVSDYLMQNAQIAVRAGAHCAPLLHEALGTRQDGAVRFSFGWFNTMDEVQTAVQAIRSLTVQDGKRLIITFKSTAMALKMEKICRAEGAEGRLIPVPREITAGCGLSWMAQPEQKDSLRHIMQMHDIIPQAEHLI